MLIIEDDISDDVNNEFEFKEFVIKIFFEVFIYFYWRYVIFFLVVEIFF